MIVCEACATEVPEQSRFCGGCGAKLRSVETARANRDVSSRAEHVDARGGSSGDGNESPELLRTSHKRRFSHRVRYLAVALASIVFLVGVFAGVSAVRAAHVRHIAEQRRAAEARALRSYIAKVKPSWRTIDADWSAKDGQFEDSVSAAESLQLVLRSLRPPPPAALLHQELLQLTDDVVTWNAAYQRSLNAISDNFQNAFSLFPQQGNSNAAQDAQAESVTDLRAVLAFLPRVRSEFAAVERAESIRHN